MNNQKSIERMLSVDKLINDKMMLVDAKNYHVSMLAELWNLYYDEGKVHLCKNILNYCKIKNSFNQIKETSAPDLLISIKDSSDNVAPYAYFKNGVIELIENSEAIRNYWKYPVRFIKSIFFRIILIIAFLRLILWFVL